MSITKDAPLNSGCMPNTDFKYEEFEGLLASYYLTLSSLERSHNPHDRNDFSEASKILNDLAKEYGVQAPIDAIANPRAKEKWAQPEVFSNFSTVDMFGSFCNDFGVGCNANTPDRIAVFNLSQVVLRVFGRNKIAEVDYKPLEMSVVFRGWIEENRERSLDDIIHGYQSI